MIDEQDPPTPTCTGDVVELQNRERKIIRVMGVHVPDTYRAAKILSYNKMLKQMTFELPDDWITLHDVQTLMDIVDQRWGYQTTKIICSHAMRRAIIQLQYQETHRDWPCDLIMVSAIRDTPDRHIIVEHK